MIQFYFKAIRSTDSAKSWHGCTWQKATLISLALVLGRSPFKKSTCVFSFELVILIYLRISSWFTLRNLTRHKERPFGDVLSHEKALSYCPPSLLSKRPVMLLLIRSGQSWNSFWSSYFRIFLLESIELAVYKHKTVIERENNNNEKKTKQNK